MSPRVKVENPVEVPVGLILNLWKRTSKAESDEIEVYFETDVTYILPNTSDSIGLFNGVVGGQGS